ncbi:glycosyltransferase family 2 protein [Pseudoalteromonas gelatinilytica]|uniref:Glycosyltransferase 2-like domain-containing protein n=1 Tax=Pseudoalteromonas gelatinilytica TaxID=1703256 RepID=A0ABQ1TQP3_9GAMM|nr:glycosyltransferase [Pseudoalteromonas profundi]GGF00144.1 hypothetical protein GCM10008027_26280 [Pseudoalteromonas profundi]
MSRLAIAIPTYNRADVLKENLLYMLDEIIEHQVAIYISDDSPNSETTTVVSELKERYSKIVYVQNTPSLGHDKNCYKTLKMPQESYIWYLGDSMKIDKGGISKVMNEITNNSSADFYITNATNRDLNLPSKHYSDTNVLFEDLAWHLTLTGCCIYKKELVHTELSTPVAKNFPQTQLILEQVFERCNLNFLAEVFISPNQNKGASYWVKNIFNVFGNDWISLIDSALKQSNGSINRTKIIKSHSKNTGIFNFKSLMKMRAEGHFAFGFYIKNHKLINLSSHLNPMVIFMIAVTPKSLLKRVQSKKG